MGNMTVGYGQTAQEVAQVMGYGIFPDGPKMIEKINHLLQSRSVQIVYLVGPITGCSYGECTDWRNGVKDTLEATGKYKCLTPMRGKKHLSDVNDIPGVIPGKVKKPGCTGHDILARDYYDCSRADVIFCNLLDSKITSIGSMFELAWAYVNRQNTYSIVIMDDNNVHMHDFILNAASIVFKTLEEGVEYLKEVLNA
jgi:hypothetical protein